MINIREFIDELNEVLDEQFPNTTRYIVKSGDHLKDVVIELREKERSLRYSPYEFFNKSNKYEDTIEQLVNQWKRILGG